MTNRADANLPLVTVITVTYNAEKVVAETIKSVQAQTYPNIEHLFVDGKSSDDTCKIIHEMIDDPSLVSEPDRGIYDAMNKATTLAKGDWIIYMNAGDRFHDANVLDAIFNADHTYEGDDFIYGDIIAQFPGYELHYPPPPMETIWKGKPFNHQALFSRRERAIEYPFDLTFRICADHDVAYYHYNLGRSFRYVPITIAVADYRDSSVGSSFWDVRKETVRVTQRHEKRFSKRLRLRLQIARILLVKKLLPQSFVRFVRSRKYSPTNRA